MRILDQKVSNDGFLVFLTTQRMRSKKSEAIPHVPVGRISEDCIQIVKILVLKSNLKI